MWTRVRGTLLVMLIALGACASAPERDVSFTEHAVSGLEKPAEIIVDAWGVPHIYAQTHYDAFFVQGFNAARDRLWQIDLWRRRGLGQLSQVLGPEYLEQDRATRLFLYRGDMYREWLPLTDTLLYHSTEKEKDGSPTDQTRNVLPNRLPAASTPTSIS